MPDSQVRVTTFYRFAEVPDCEELQRELAHVCESQGLLGTILVAPEGVNATVSGSVAAVDALVTFLSEVPGFADLDCKHSLHDEQPFLRMKVRIRPEIITFGVPAANPGVRTGEHVDSARWNALINDPDVTILDTRNDYEVHVGTFARAKHLNMSHFREFPEAVQRELDPQRNPRVAMFCTGGVRCEKAAAHLLNEGFQEVYQLDGGVLRYLEQTPVAENRWQGECFVFDERVTVDTALQAGAYRLCRGCRYPVSDAEAASPLFEPGVCCPNCHDRQSPEQLESYRQRYRQEQLARTQRGSRFATGEDA